MSRIPPGASNLILTRSALPPSLVVDGVLSSIIPQRSTRGNLPSTPCLPAVGFLPLHQSSRLSALPPSILLLLILPPSRFRHQSSRLPPTPGPHLPPGLITLVLPVIHRYIMPTQYIHENATSSVRCKIFPFWGWALDASRKIKIKIVGATVARSLFHSGSEPSVRVASHPAGFQPKRGWSKLGHPGWGGPENCALGSGIASVPLALSDVQISSIILYILPFLRPNTRGFNI